MADEVSRIRLTIDLDEPGKHRGHMIVPWSRDDSAWGSIRIPITVICGGEGPHLLLVGGSHGDEYEGPIALMKLAAGLEPSSIQGTVMILPTMNLPAVRAGTVHRAGGKHDADDHQGQQLGKLDATELGNLH